MKKIKYWNLYICYKEKGYTQKQLAKLLSISPQRLSLKIIGKDADFTMPEARKLSELFDKPIDELFSTSIKVNSED